MRKITTLITTISLTIISTYVSAQNASYGNISFGKATNISGKQRMLSQRIAKLFMLKVAGSSGIHLNQEYNSSIQLFQRNLSILEANSKSSSAKVKSAIRKETSEWESFKSSLRKKDKSNINVIMNSSNQLLKKCHALVLAIEEDSKYNKEFLNENTNEQLKVETVNISGKQRMLSQRLCLYYTACRVYRKEKLDSKGMCVKVKEIYNEMNASLNSLLINDLNTFPIEQNIGKILSLINNLEDNKKDFFNNNLPLVTMVNLTNKITNLYNVVTGQYTSL